MQAQSVEIEEVTMLSNIIGHVVSEACSPSLIFVHWYLADELAEPAHVVSPNIFQDIFRLFHDLDHAVDLL